MRGAMARVEGEVGAAVIELVKLTRMPIMSAIKKDERSLLIIDKHLEEGGDFRSARKTELSEARRLSVSRWKVCTTRLLFCSAYASIYWTMMVRVLEGIVQDALAGKGSFDLLALFLRYDETPLPVICIDSHDVMGIPPEFRRGRARGRQFQRWLKDACRDPAPAKLLQTEVVIAILVTLRGRRLAVGARPPVPWLALEKETTEVFWAAITYIEGIMGIRKLEKLADCVFRGVGTDRFSAILKFERALNASRPEIILLHLTCFIHKLCDARMWVVKVQDELVSVLTSMVLSLRGGHGFMKLYREAMREEIEARVDFPPGQPSMRGRARNASEMGWFMANERKNATK